MSADKLNSFIFERKEPYQDKDIIKDGIHLVYPFIVCDTDIQHLIREEVLRNCESILNNYVVKMVMKIKVSLIKQIG